MKKKKKIFVWIKDERDNKLQISTKSILVYACSLKIAFSNKKTDAQIRWIYRFIKRFALFN